LVLNTRIFVYLKTKKLRVFPVFMRPVRQVSSLENRSLGLDANWQPVRGDLIAHPWTGTLLWG